MNMRWPVSISLLSRKDKTLNYWKKQVSGRFLLDTHSDRCIYYIAFAKEQRIRSEPCVQPCCARAACRSGGEAGFGINSSGTSRGKMLEVRL